MKAQLINHMRLALQLLTRRDDDLLTKEEYDTIVLVQHSAEELKIANDA